MEARDMKKVQGVVAAVAQNSADRYGFRIGDAWYGGFGTCPVEKGASVEVVYVDNGVYHNVKEIQLLAEEAEANSNGFSESEGAAAREMSRDERVARAVALKSAVLLHAALEIAELSAVVKTAERFERWLNATSSGTEAV